MNLVNSFTYLKSDGGIEEELLLGRAGELRVNHDASRDVLLRGTVFGADLNRQT